MTDPNGLESLPPLQPKPQRVILAICGGGYAGLFAAEFLRRLEGRLGRPLIQVFDLLAGTSIGGLIALGLAAGQSAERVSAMLEELGPELFGRPSGGLFKPKHDRSALERKLNEILGDRMLAELPARILVPAVDLTAGETIVYRNGPADDTRNVKAVDAALATSAAPFFLSPHAADERLYADGGLVANSPEAIASVEAVHRLHWERDRTTMLVVGSTQTCARIPGHLADAPWGAIRWAKDKRIVAATMRAQMSLARQTALALLGPNRLLVADVELSPAEQETIALDKVTAKSTQNLKTLAASRFDVFESAYPGYQDRLCGNPDSARPAGGMSAGAMA